MRSQRWPKEGAQLALEQSPKGSLWRRFSSIGSKHSETEFMLCDPSHSSLNYTLYSLLSEHGRVTASALCSSGGPSSAHQSSPRVAFPAQDSSLPCRVHGHDPTGRTKRHSVLFLLGPSRRTEKSTPRFRRVRKAACSERMLNTKAAV